MRKQNKKLFFIHPYKIEVGAGLISLANIIAGVMIINQFDQKNNFSITKGVIGFGILILLYQVAILVIKNERSNGIPQ
jgi:hypothetical protein